MRALKISAVIALMMAGMTTAESQINITGAGALGRSTSGPVTCVGTGLIFNVPCNSQYIPIGLVL